MKEHRMQYHKKQYRKLNPSNARIDIDYEKDNVDIEYVHNKSAFSVCHQTFSSFWTIPNVFILSAFYILYILSNYYAGILEAIIILSIIAIWIISIPLILALAFSKNEKLLKMMPNINYKLSFCKPIIAEFTPNDVDDLKCEIPLFENIGLDYNATEEFSKYLIKVKIVEHGFNDLIKGKRILNPYYWKAIFYFKKAPLTGKLLVRFK